MCGIFAWWPACPHPATTAAAQRALDVLAPRGPDGENLWSAPDNAAHLGHRRLAITGKFGTQPLWDSSRTLVAVVNGEFYDAPAARRRYSRDGWRFATDTDSELLLPLYRRHGTDALQELEGEFAFVLWDRAAGKVWMARDRAGVRPLRVALGPLGLAAASEAKALLAAGWPARWDADALAQSLAIQYPVPSATLFDGIGQLEPGESRVYTRRGPEWSLERRRWWRWFPLAESALVCPGPDAATDDLIDRLGAAVDRRLDTDWPVAVHLSGGTDSSAIAALAARRPRPYRSRAGPLLHAFTVGFESNRAGPVAHDERHHARSTAERLGLPWTCVPVSRADVLAHWDQAVARAESFGVNGHLVAKWLLARAIHQADFRVSLTGEGADEALLGYAFLAADAAATGTPIDQAALWAANPVSLGTMLPDGEGLDLAAVRDAWGWVPTWVSAKAVRGARLASLMTPEWRNERLPTAIAAWASAEAEAFNPKAHRAQQAAATWGRLALGGYILPALADAPEAGFAIQNRVPFLDAGVLGLTASWHPSVAGWAADPKAPLRRWLARQGLTEVAARPKHPFEAPPLWGDPSVRARLRARWSDPARWTATPFDPVRVGVLMDRLDAAGPAEHQRFEPVLATLLSVEACAHAFHVESAP